MTGNQVDLMHVFGPFDRGGAELRTMELVEEFKRRSAKEVVVVSLGRRAGSMDEAARRLGVRVERLAPGVRSLPALFWLLRRERPAILHSHLFLFSGFVLMVGWATGVPRRIAHIRSTGSGRRRSAARRLRELIMTWLIARFATDVVAVSESVRDAVWSARTARARPCTVIRQGVRRARLPESSAEPQSSRPLLVQVGRIGPEKNQLKAIEIAEALRRDHPSLKLELIGPAADEEYLARVVMAGHTSLGVEVVGEVTEGLPQRLARADAMLHPSLREGSPGAVLEACAVGTPVVASNISSIAEVARLLPEAVCLVDVDAPTSAWVAAAEAILTRDSATVRTNIVEAFGNSPYDFEASVGAHMKLWAHE